MIKDKKELTGDYYGARDWVFTGGGKFYDGQTPETNSGKNMDPQVLDMFIPAGNSISQTEALKWSETGRRQLTIEYDYRHSKVF